MSQQGSDRVLHNVVNDIGRRVVHAACLFNLGLVFNDRAVAIGEADDLAEKLFIHLTENVGGEHGEFIRAVGIIQAADDIFQGLVVNDKI